MSSHREVAIDVTSRHGHVSDRMEEYVTKKAERLLRYNDQISRIEIIVDGPHEAPQTEMLVHIDNAAMLIAKDHADHFNAAIDGLVDKMERQLVRAKEKLKNHKGEVDKIPVDEPSGEREDSFDDVVRRELDS